MNMFRTRYFYFVLASFFFSSFLISLNLWAASFNCLKVMKIVTRLRNNPIDSHISKPAKNMHSDLSSKGGEQSPKYLLQKKYNLMKNIHAFYLWQMNSLEIVHPEINSELDQFVRQHFKDEVFLNLIIKLGPKIWKSIILHYFSEDEVFSRSVLLMVYASRNLDRTRQLFWIFPNPDSPEEIKFSEFYRTHKESRSFLAASLFIDEKWLTNLFVASGEMMKNSRNDFESDWHEFILYFRGKNGDFKNIRYQYTNLPKLSVNKRAPIARIFKKILSTPMLYKMASQPEIFMALITTFPLAERDIPFHLKKAFK